MNSTIQLPAHNKRFFLADILSLWRLSKPLGIVLFLAVHILLGLLMFNWPMIGTAHSFATLLVGVWIAGSSSRPEEVATIAAYVT